MNTELSFQDLVLILNMKLCVRLNCNSGDILSCKEEFNSPATSIYFLPLGILITYGWVYCLVCMCSCGGFLSLLSLASLLLHVRYKEIVGNLSSLTNALKL